MDLGSETIIINYKNEDFKFIDSPSCSSLNNVYVYMGLQKALYRFIVNYSKDQKDVELNEMEIPTNGLDMKSDEVKNDKIRQCREY